jgi:outer membrane protein assembly factor BamB
MHEPSEEFKVAPFPGTTTHPKRATAKPARPVRRTRRGVVLALATLLVVGALVGAFLLVRPRTLPVHGSGTFYSVTPQGGQPLPKKNQPNTGGLAVLSAPTPPFFLDGSLYRDTQVYRADTGVLVQQYLPTLGKVMVYDPKLVDGMLFMAVRVGRDQGAGKMVMFALRASDGTLLWRWDNCGESDNMTAPLISGDSLSFACESAPGSWRLYGLQASTGKLRWSNNLPGEVDSALVGDQQALYIQAGDQILVESTATGRLLWHKSFGDSISQIALNRGIVYVSDAHTFSALKSSDGSQLWAYKFIGDYTSIQAIVTHTMTYLFANEQSRLPNIYALDSATGILRWQKHLPSQEYAPAFDQGNLYLISTVFVPMNAYSSSPIKRTLLAIGGRDGHILWQQDIAWNKNKLNVSLEALPELTAGDGRIYLIDWTQSVSDYTKLSATMAAFAESNGRLLWSRGGFGQN